MFEHDLTDPHDVGLNADRLDAIPEYFQEHYLDTGKLPCVATLVSRGGEVALEDYSGTTELGGGKPIGPDTIFRIYSMTKPVTSLAAMMLFEEGKLRLDHEVSRYIPEFADTQVFDSGNREDYTTRKPDREITLLDLFTHTSGIPYGFLMQDETDAIYRKHKISETKETLLEMSKRIAGLPLAFSPGERWCYGHSIDVLGAVVEIVSGQPLDEFFRERIFCPLGMEDTGFWVPEDKIDRLMACYSKHPITGEVTESDGAGAASKLFSKRPTLLNAGGGLVSTVRDYHRFCLMLMRGGTLDDARIISPKTWEFMRQNHLPDGKTIKDMGDKTFSEARMEGNGFGLGGSVLVDPVASMQPSSQGNFSWGGLASTFFWIDPVEEMIAIQATQMIPSGTYPIRPQLQQLVYAAVDW
ncbi:MAG: beta-lactamase family protein [Alphaproteobacteria bacterium]|nr:serine hydrolase [Hyphomonas sp.]MBR9807107.1 beta-lactamase family protein [Alphaproteobacteria bacterium]|tara:strand:+ start:519 stop:1754 length:1236 start_codon:yes stop_codon:yes gene_type:complete